MFTCLVFYILFYNFIVNLIYFNVRESFTYIIFTTPFCGDASSVMTDIVSKESDAPVGEVPKKGRRRTRRAGTRAARRRARRSSATLAAVTATIAPEKIISPTKCAVHAFLLKYQSAMRKIPAQLPPKVHAGPPTKRVKRVSWRKLCYYVLLRSPRLMTLEKELTWFIEVWKTSRLNCFPIAAIRVVRLGLFVASRMAEWRGRMLASRPLRLVWKWRSFSRYCRYDTSILPTWLIATRRLLFTKVVS